MPSYNVLSATLPQIAVSVGDYTEALNTATALAKAIAKTNPGHEVQVIDAATIGSANPRIVRRCYGAPVERIEVVSRAKPASVTPPPNRFAVSPASRRK